MATLRELDADLAAIQDIMNAPNVDLESMGEGLNALNIQREAKIKNIGFLILDLESEQAAIRNEIDRLQDLLRTRKNKSEWLRGYVLGSMTAAGETAVHDPLISIRVGKPRPVVQVNDVKKVPDRYMTHPEPSPNKRAIMDALKAGQSVPGCELGEGRPWLTIA